MGKLRSIVLAAAAVSITSAAFAQTSTKPTTAGTDADAPQVSSPYWNPQGTTIIQPPALPYGEGLMEKAVLAVPQARADAVAAKWQFRRANNTLNISADNMRRDFNESEEYTAAVNDFKQAYRDLENARLDALKSLRTTADYEAIEAMRKSINSQIADERDQDKPSLDRLVALAQLKMDSIAPVRSAEQQTIENSSAVREARNRLIDGAKRVARIEREFAREVRDSIDLADARKAREDARIAMLASSAYLSEARTARDIAVRYSYLSRGINRPRGNGISPYSSYGGGYDYGYGYGGGSYGYGYGGVNYGLNNVGFITGGVTGRTGFGLGSNAFTGRGGNAFGIGRPGTVRSSPADRVPGAGAPGQPFGPTPGEYPSPFGTGSTPSPFGGQ